VEQLSRVGGGFSGLVGLDPRHGDERQPGVADLLEQPVQCGLVDYRTPDEGDAVPLTGEGHPVEPGGPSRIEVPLEADLVLPGFIRQPLGWVRFSHGLKLGAEVVSRDHQMW
jgi:hypothetical protein